MRPLKVFRILFFLLFAAPVAPAGAWTWDMGAAEPDIVREGSDENDFFGTSMVSGDLNGDGKKDLIVGGSEGEAWTTRSRGPARFTFSSISRIQRKVPMW